MTKRTFLALCVMALTPSLLPAVAGAGSQSESKLYEKSIDQVWDATVASFKELDWKIKDEKKEDGLITAKAKMGLTTYGAIINVNMTENDGKVKVAASASTQQVLDKKKNQKELERFFETLDAKLADKK